ncbi:hypothetical protein DAPPUDRAFT_259105 [Daphnia pulex]|uniref:Uncharacterized protein n=1 Tax=Daphnia pulex TaxID=6669 RepID=E9HGK0_DAPPU|nr:hypothetical protein DAPPUDRAFT_259105 [Daphnia pulex]|eukprot:EFX69097.1 hypothetical protein DAPPUDRAFT_259105 [Daphnia pulex]
MISVVSSSSGVVASLLLHKTPATQQQRTLKKKTNATIVNRPPVNIGSPGYLMRATTDQQMLYVLYYTLLYSTPVLYFNQNFFQRNYFLVRVHFIHRDWIVLRLLLD